MAPKHLGEDRVSHDSAGRGGAALEEQAADRTSRLLSRIDRHLRVLTNDPARLAFLTCQIEGWERRYARFLHSHGDSEPMIDRRDPPQAADFVATITALAARRIALRTSARHGQEGCSPSC
ncbi:MAG: hypothetical protein IT537_24665 [Hyphomicrobiales bacterium]|nr:hypothetical protein [Hyphomicrobiales bacterium]